MTPSVGFGRVVVVGTSMLPVLGPGDRCLVRWGAHARVGDVVVARRPDRSELLVVKRLIAYEADGAWLEGDNTQGSHDSWVFGPVGPEAVIGVVMWRYRPRPGRVRRSVPH